MSPQGPQSGQGVPPQQTQGLDFQKLLQWLMARGALGKAAGTTPPPVPPPVAPDPYAELRKAIAMNPNNAPQEPSPVDLKVLSTPRKKKR